jgi:hypothetical protein
MTEEIGEGGGGIVAGRAFIKGVPAQTKVNQAILFHYK